MAHAIAGRFILGGRARSLRRNQYEAVLYSAAERATYGTTKSQPFYSRRPSAQPMAHAIAGRFVLGGRARNLWPNQWQAVLFSAAGRAIHGVSSSRPFHHRRPSELFMARPTGGPWRPGEQRMAQARAGSFVNRAECATDDDTKRSPFSSRRPSAQPVAQARAAKRTTYGATSSRPFCYRGPSAHPMSQPR